MPENAVIHTGPPWLLLLSASDRAVLGERARVVAAALSDGADPARVVPSEYGPVGGGSERLAVAAAGHAGLLEGLSLFAEGAPSPRWTAGRVTEPGGQVAWCFGGHGGQWPGMGRDLLDGAPPAARVLIDLDALLPSGVLGPLRETGREDFDKPAVAQPLIFAVQVAMARWTADRRAAAVSGPVRTFGDTLRQLRTEAGLTQGELAKQANWSQNQISRTEQNLFTPDDATIQRLDRALHANGQLIAAYATGATPSAELVHPGRDPLVFSDLLRKIHRTDVGRDTIDQLTVITEQLCCEYVSRRPEELREDAHHQLEYIQRLLEGPTRLGEHRELLVIAGWLSLLIGCVNYDLGLARHAETARIAACQLGREAGHGEIIAWSFEVSAWFALTQGRLRSVLDYAEAGIKAAPQASVAVQLAAQAAKAHARMGNRSEVRRALDQGFRLLDGHEYPRRPENHFVIDPAKWDFYAMDCYRIGGDDARAAEHANEVLRLSERPDGSDRSPTRATEARLTLAIVSLRDGDIDRAADWARKAFHADRKSVNSLSMVTDELYHEARKHYGDDPAINALNDVITSFYTSISNR